MSATGPNMTTNVDPIFDWLVDGAPGANGPDRVVERLGPLAPRVRRAGDACCRVRQDTASAHHGPLVRLASRHTERGGSRCPLRMFSRMRPPFRTSPAGQVFATGEELRRRLAGSAELESDELANLRRDGFTDYVVEPLRFLDGQVHAIAFATDSPEGFTDDVLSAIRRIPRRPLSRLAEILALRRTATNLLNAYVGRGAGERILQGHVQRGDTESVRCVIWFSDLRGFTTLSARSAPQAIISVLNRIFDCQVPFIEAAGGEVLKFMGDGLGWPSLSSRRKRDRRGLARAPGGSSCAR